MTEDEKDKFHSGEEVELDLSPAKPSTDVLDDVLAAKKKTTPSPSQSSSPEISLPGLDGFSQSERMLVFGFTLAALLLIIAIIAVHASNAMNQVDNYAAYEAFKELCPTYAFSEEKACECVATRASSVFADLSQDVTVDQIKSQIFKSVRDRKTFFLEAQLPCQHLIYEERCNDPAGAAIFEMAGVDNFRKGCKCMGKATESAYEPLYNDLKDDAVYESSNGRLTGFAQATIKAYSEQVYKQCFGSSSFPF